MLRVSVGAETSAGLYIMSYKAHFYFDYYTKRSNTPDNMSSRKRSKTYWPTNTFAPSVEMCIARTMSSVKRSNMNWSTNMSLLKRSNMY